MLIIEHIVIQPNNLLSDTNNCEGRKHIPRVSYNGTYVTAELLQAYKFKIPNTSLKYYETVIPRESFISFIKLEAIAYKLYTYLISRLLFYMVTSYIPI